MLVMILIVLLMVVEMPVVCVVAVMVIVVSSRLVQVVIHVTFIREAPRSNLDRGVNSSG
jgi:hypothetical protein